MDHTRETIDEPVSIRMSRPTRSASWTPVVIVCYTLGLLICLVLALGDRLGDAMPWDTSVGGVVGLLGLALLIATFPLALKIASDRPARTAGVGGNELAEAVRNLTEQTALSDDARRVLNRRTERDVLCRAIEEDIRSEEWDAAVVLCDELANRFGYRADAEDFRHRIESGRGEMVARQLADSVASIEGSILQRRWDEANAEAKRIARRFPDSERAEGLVQRVRSAREAYRATLERQFLEAAGADRVDEAMRLLKELDAYLTEEDAERYKEVARGVIGKAKENLGARFKLAVQDREWGAAARVGRQIINEFPNTRMAHEVRRLLDGILAKANAPEVGHTQTSEHV